ncbi:MAG: tRNA epoxyqueuosine(34) reductase QueG [Paludibacteraceae bacterium]|nr:tRNA epoxyqueuosine(34) reductase QueG [Paludibacteraceae bacterium]
MTSSSRIRELALSVGFDDAGCAVAHRLDEDAERLKYWLEQGREGSMQYMQAHFEERVNPEALVPGTRTVVCCVLSYYKVNPQPAGAPYIAMSGLSERDYHEVVKEKLRQLERLLIEEQGEQIVNPNYQHLFCDSAPVLERAWARECGLGAIGKNRQFIHPTLGSYVHLGLLFLQEEVEGAEVSEHSEHADKPSLCAECRRCLDACPTRAITEQGMDARRCVSYLTIERKEPLPEEHIGRPYMRNLYGCDNCQRVCPYNQRLQPDRHPELSANPRFAEMTADDWAATSRKQKTKLLRRLARNE